jgi:predicted transcriptional regulator
MIVNEMLGRLRCHSCNLSSEYQCNEQGRTTKVKEISTKSANLITASPEDTVDSCMAKMLSRDIRHLPLVDDKGKVVGIISIKDLIKSSLEEKEHTIHSLASFAVGEGGHFVM